jgi:hypothetical protein
MVVKGISSKDLQEQNYLIGSIPINGFIHQSSILRRDGFVALCNEMRLYQLTNKLKDKKYNISHQTIEKDILLLEKFQTIFLKPNTNGKFTIFTD